jgi:hypothetical protein
LWTRRSMMGGSVMRFGNPVSLISSMSTWGIIWPEQEFGHNVGSLLKRLTVTRDVLGYRLLVSSLRLSLPSPPVSPTSPAFRITSIGSRITHT